MKNNKKRSSYWISILAFVVVIVMYIAFCVISWVATCGVVKFITWCFDWAFNWMYATGIWAILLLICSNVVNYKQK